MQKHIIAAVAVAVIALSTPAQAAGKGSKSEIQELKALVQKLATRVEELETQKVASEKTAKEEKTALAARLDKIEPAAGRSSRSMNRDYDTVAWNGPYLGAFLALNQGQNDLRAGVASEVDVNGVSGGLQLGYNHRMRDVLIGLEIEASLVDASSDPVLFPLGSQTEKDSTFALRGRLGRIFGSNLLFVQAGWSGAQLVVNSVPGGVSFLDETVWGPEAGFGFEQAISSNFSWRADYLYSNYGEQKSNLAPAIQFDTSNHAFRLGVAYHY